jgi:hypothetical protein
MSTALVMVGSALCGVMVATPVPTAKSISSTAGLLWLAQTAWLVSALIWLMAS